MMQRLRTSFLLATFCALVALSGCGSTNPPDTDSATTSSSDGGHDDHGHSHEPLGPHGGHIMELGNEQYHAEWTHDDAAKSITVFFLDSEATSDAEVEAGSPKIELTIEGKEPVTYMLEPAAEGGFTNADSALFTGLNMVGHGVQATLHATIDGQDFAAEFEHHHHDHGHTH